MYVVSTTAYIKYPKVKYIFIIISVIFLNLKTYLYVSELNFHLFKRSLHLCY